MSIIEEVAKAFGAHSMWRPRLMRASASGKSEFRPEDIAKDSLCTFGRWLHNPDLPGDIRDSEDYRTIRRLHLDFHNAASATMVKALAGDRQGAEADLADGAFTKASESLHEAMFAWQRVSASACGRIKSPLLRRLCLGVRGNISLRIWAAVTLPSVVSWLCLIALDLDRLAAVRAVAAADPAAAGAAWQGFYILNLLFVLAVAAGSAVVFFLARSISQPMQRLAEATRQLAKGDLKIALPAMDRSDEIGEVARAVLVFQQQGVAVERLAVEQERNREAGEQERRKALVTMAENIEGQTREVVARIATESERVHQAAKRMAGGAANVESNSKGVTAAAEQSLSNAETVASATEELSASIREIAGQMAKSRQVVGEAVQAADKAASTVRELSEAMTAIDQVVQLIADIASQTNLLALNATIEAARAGDAGKGFAVVAGEVKNLANQTARQTQEITQRIAALKDMAGRMVGAIETTVASIESVEAIASMVAAAVEEQDAATKEISATVQQSAAASREVTSRIREVAAEAVATGEQSGQLESMLDAMAEQVRELGHVLNRVVRTATPDVNRRHEPRIPLQTPARLACRGIEHEGRLADISASGARLAGEMPFKDGDQGILKLSGLDVPVGVIECANGFCRVRIATDRQEEIRQWLKTRASGLGQAA